VFGFDKRTIVCELRLGEKPAVAKKKGGAAAGGPKRASEDSPGGSGLKKAKK